MYSPHSHEYPTYEMYQPVNYAPINQSNKASKSLNQPESFGGLAPPSYNESRFHNSQYRDFIWAILHVLHILLIVSLGFYYLFTDSGRLFGSLNQSIDQTSNLLSWPVLVTIACTIFISMGVSLAYLVLMRRYPSELIKFTSYVSIGMLFVGFLFSLLSGSLMGALMSGLLFGLQIYWYQSIKHRIPFSAVLCEIAGTILRSYPGTFVVAMIGMFAQFAWFAVWLLCSTAIYRNLANNVEAGQEDNQINATLVGLLLSLYWTSMVISYVVQATVAGVAGVWYFLVDNQSVNQSEEVHNPTYHSFNRAITTSFGSLSLAALVLAVVKTLRAVVQTIANQRFDDDNRSLLTDIAIGCASFLLSILDALISYINAYSITRIAIYGESFLVASDRSLTLLKHRGLDAVVNDSLVGTACTIGALVVAVISALLVSLVALFWLPTTESVFAISFIAFLIAFALCSTALETVEAAVMAIFVSLAEDPNVLYQTKPDVYERLVTAITVRYPHCRLDCDTESQRYQRQYGAFAM